MSKVILLVCALSACHFLGFGKLIGIGTSTPSKDFTGEKYTQQGPTNIRSSDGPARFGLRFIDDTAVEGLVNGRKTGPTMSYKMKGKNRMVVTHACGTYEIDIQEDGRLYREDFRFHYALDN